MVKRPGGRFCSRTCANRAPRSRGGTSRDPQDRRVQRYQREGAAPGLTRAERDALAARWRRQRRPCAYCGERPADTVDHVVPLVRGGTNGEGNLAPACRTCNGSKGPWLLVEWRAHRRPQFMLAPLVRRAPRPRLARVKAYRQAELSTCRLPGCGGLTLGAYCDAECQAEKYARQSRDAYRARMGLSVDPSEPTSMFGRRRMAKAG